MANLLRLFILYFAAFIPANALVHDNEIVVKILGGYQVANILAQEMGFLFKGHVRGFRDTYILVPKYENISSPQKRGHLNKRRLLEDERILWVDQQEVKHRYKRDFLPWYELKALKSSRMKRLKEANQAMKRPLPENLDKTFNDELWSQEWYLQDTRTRPDLPKLDLNVLPLYRLGITGKGVRISVLDDGIEYLHEDLKENYDPEISWDCNEEDNDPLPRYEPSKQNSHGTRCAGEIAMAANNKKCGVGIAFNAKVGGVKLLDGLVNDRIEGTALSYAQDLVDIYSASWGPNDDGKTVDGPARLAKDALEQGIKKGRKGRGSIYVWASGNGGSHGDNCNCDGYLASPYTITIGSASQRGEFPWYGEACASTLAVTYSSGAYQDQMIATTDLHNECTIKHTGTSASAPLAAGIIALALEVNQNLTWRDVQHLVVWTSELDPVAENPGWKMNGAGLWTNTRFGFGLMNGLSFVKAASTWKTVPDQFTCEIYPATVTNKSVSYNKPLVVPILTNACKDSGSYVRHLEHVELRINLDYSIRGSLEIFLTSPSGTRVQLLGPRKLDKSSDGFQDWTFMSVMTWGEPAEGLWILEITDNIGPSDNTGQVDKIGLIFHGTFEQPDHMKAGPRIYNHNYNRVRNHLQNSKLKDLNSENVEKLLQSLKNVNENFWN